MKERIPVQLKTMQDGNKLLLIYQSSSGKKIYRPFLIFNLFFIIFIQKKLFLNQIVYASFRWLFSIFTNILYNFPLNFYKFFIVKILCFFLKIINYFPYNFSISVSDCISIFRFVGQHILHLKQFLRFLKFKSSEELNVKVKGGTNYRVTWALLGSQANAI